MHEFIKSVTSSLNLTGLSPRAATLFTQAMTTGQYRWGRKARLVAGACIAIALREVKRPDSLHDIAHLLGEPHFSLSRTFTAIVSLLKLSLPPTGPNVYVSTLQSYLGSLLQPNQQDCKLAASIISILESLPMRVIANTASLLLDTLSQSNPEIYSLSAAPTACAAFILAIEAENRSTLNGLANLAECLGARCNVGKAVVMSRYKLIQDAVALWIAKVPWLDQYQSKKGRAKVPKRLIVVRGLKDVIHFHEEISRDTSKLVAAAPGASQDKKGSPSRQALENLSDSGSVEDRPTKKRRMHKSLQHASRFLLDPLSAPLPSNPQSSAAHATGFANLPMTSYILNGQYGLRDTPTRLQLLAIERGGAGFDQINDEELFDELEFEGMLRTEAELEQLKAILHWDETLDASTESQNALSESEEVFGPRKSWMAGRTEAMGRRSSARINMDAFARLMADDDIDQDGIDQDGDRADGSFASRLDSTPDGEVIVEAWRPLSPQRGAQHEQYEQEYE